jgi:hypothetical protein
MIHTQQNQESVINKPKNLIVNETNNKFQENSLNKSKNNYNERTVTQSAVVNTQFNNSILNTQQNLPSKNEGKKLNISANNGQ